MAPPAAAARSKASAFPSVIVRHKQHNSQPQQQIKSEPLEPEPPTVEAKFDPAGPDRKERAYKRFQLEVALLLYFGLITSTNQGIQT